MAYVGNRRGDLGSVVAVESESGMGGVGGRGCRVLSDSMIRFFFAYAGFLW
jgi:hypothetical protein